MLFQSGASFTPSGSSENFTNTKKQQSELQSEFSDYGYGTQLENQGSISTSSNDDDVPVKKPVHQKPHSKIRLVKQKSPQEKKEERRQKLIRRSKTNM